MKLKFVFALCTLLAIAEAQWAAARGLYQPIALSIGTVYTAVNMSSSKNGESESKEGWFGSAVNKLKEKIFKKPEVKEEEYSLEAERKRWGERIDRPGSGKKPEVKQLDESLEV